MRRYAGTARGMSGNLGRVPSTRTITASHRANSFSLVHRLANTLAFERRCIRSNFVVFFDHTQGYASVARLAGAAYRRSGCVKLFTRRYTRMEADRGEVPNGTGSRRAYRRPRAGRHRLAGRDDLPHRGSRPGLPEERGECPERVPSRAHGAAVPEAGRDVDRPARPERVRQGVSPAGVVLRAVDDDGRAVHPVEDRTHRSDARHLRGLPEDEIVLLDPRRVRHRLRGASFRRKGRDDPRAIEGDPPEDRARAGNRRHGDRRLPARVVPPAFPSRGPRSPCSPRAPHSPAVSAHAGGIISPCASPALPGTPFWFSRGSSSSGLQGPESPSSSSPRSSRSPILAPRSTSR